MHDLIGKQIATYLMEAAAGSGNVGHVYRARDKQTQQTAALKIIHDHLARQADFRDRFLANAATLPELSHQAMARVYSIGDSDGQLYIATEWVKGESLAQVLANRPPLAPRLGARLVQLVAEALVYTHRQGAVHGGLHPGNVLLQPRGGDLPWQPLVTDFRQASLIKGEPPLALLPYLSPEQCDGKRANGRSDIYALGVMLYQLITGQLPFQPKTAREVVASGPPTPPRSLRPDISNVFEAIMLKAMAHSNAERYRSMEEFLLFLRREVDKLPMEGPGVMPQAAPPPPAAAPSPAYTPSPPPVAPSPPVTPPPVQAAPARSPATSSDADYLIISHPRLPEQTYPLRKWLITIGQREDNDLVLTGEGVAQKHARLERTDTGWNVIDMGSLDGTYLENSQLLADLPEPWKAGQRVRLGEYGLVWHSGTAQVAAEQPAKPSVAPVMDTGRLYMSLNPTQLATHPGSPAQAVLEVENQTSATTLVTLSASSIPAAWVAIEPEPIRLSPQQKVVVPFTIQPPRHSSATAGPHPFQMEARPDKGTMSTAVSPGQITLHPFQQFFVECQPASLRHGKSGHITLHNEGNTPGRYTLSAADVSNQIMFDLPQRDVEVLPGQSQSVSMVGRARKRPFFLRTDIIPFEVNVTTSGGLAVTQPGRFIVPPLLSWPILLLLALPLLLLFLFVAYYGGTDYAEPCQGYFKDADLEQACIDVTLSPEAPPTALAVSADTAVPVTTTVTTEIPTEASATAVATLRPTAPPVALAAESIIIGQSFNGTDIEAVKLGNGPNAVLFVGGVYAGFSPASVSLSKQVVIQLAADASLVPGNVTVYVVPNWNPDSESGNNRRNGNGVDLNRNWGCNWQALDDGRAGTGPLSEPESQALGNFINDISPVAVIFWNTPTQPLNYKLVSPGRCTQAQTAASLTLAELYAGQIDGYAADQADTGQRISGDVTDSIADMGIPTIFVLLDSPAQAEAAQHMPAIQAILNAYNN